MLGGRATGMIVGTLLVRGGGFSSIVEVAGVQVYAAVVNLVVAVVLTPVLDRFGVPRGVDATSVAERVDRPDDDERR